MEKKKGFVYDYISGHTTTVLGHTDSFADNNEWLNGVEVAGMLLLRLVRQRCVRACLCHPHENNDGHL